MYRFSGGLTRAGIFCSLLLALLTIGLASAQALRSDRESLPAKSEYRSELEEVVVVGKAPEWRKQADQQKLWRPEKFKLQAPENSSRLQWFPEYTKDERDNYLGVQDRRGEKAEFQLFNWKF